VDDPEILSAIRWHTTGRGDMTLLEKIVFTADYIEPNRFKASNLPEIRRLAFEDLSYCVYRISEDTLSYLRNRGIPVDPMTGECYQWLKENGNHDK
jgi:predicted HD superfamily hydrolase involved in NAD metabolism